MRFMLGRPCPVRDDELAHHASILVLEDVAVEHVRGRRIAVVLKLVTNRTVSSGGT
jgi:hypothetical protein